MALSSIFATEEMLIDVGVAQIDVTPDYPVRLSGYGFRRDEAEGFDQRIRAKALAIGNNDVSLLLTVDHVGIPGWMMETVFENLAQNHDIERKNFVLASSHTHCAPVVTGSIPFLFAEDLPEDHRERIDRYTAELTEKLTEVGRQALADREPAFLSWTEGTVGFARNRRQASGPVDHSVPVIAVHAPDRTVRAVWANYACHCTTVRHNRIHGDWAGHAQEFIENDFPGSIAFISIGAGGDANPHPRGDLDLAREHGRSLADEVARLLEAELTPLTEPPAGKFETIELAFEPLPDREVLAAKANEPGIVGYHARKYLERLENEEPIPTTLPYSVQGWHWGDRLAMVFLPGEVVADYSLRTKGEFDRIWITAYANDVPAYIPSERVLDRAHAEYRYEAADSMLFYGQPGPFARGLEEKIVEAIRKVVPSAFAAEQESP